LMMILIDGDLQFERPDKSGSLRVQGGANPYSGTESDFTQCEASGAPELRFFATKNS